MSDTDMVPRSRLNEEIAKRRELEADLGALRGNLAAAEAKAAEAETVRAALAKATAEFETYKVGVDAGITDPEGLELARYYYDKVPTGEGDDAKPAFGDWMAKLKTDATARPKGLGAYFADQPAVATATPAAAPVAPPKAAQAAPPRSAAPLPPAATGANPAPTPSPTAAGWTRESIAQMDPATWAANRADLIKAASAGLVSKLGGA